MPPIPGAPIGISGLSSFFSTITHSVVRNIPAIEAAFSKAITDLQKMMSEIEDISCNNEWCHIKGKVPLNTSKDYASEVSSYTKGLGIFMVKPCGYQITKDGYSDLSSSYKCNF